MSAKVFYLNNPASERPLIDDSFRLFPLKRYELLPYALSNLEICFSNLIEFSKDISSGTSLIWTDDTYFGILVLTASLSYDIYAGDNK